MNLVARVASRLRRPPRFRRLVVVKGDLDQALELVPAAIDLEFIDTFDDVERLRALLIDVPIEHRMDLDERWLAGQRCFIAQHRGRTVHATWVAFGSCYSYMLDRTYELGEHEFYMHGAFTLPEFRRRGIQLATSCHYLNLLRERGFRRALGLFDPHNQLAERAVYQRGFARAGVSGFVEVFGLRVYFHRDGDAFSALRRHTYWRRM